MEAFVASMAFCEVPFEGTLVLPVRAGDSASTSDREKRGGDAVKTSSSLAAFVVSMAFCEALFEGTLALPVRARDSASTSDREKRGGAAVNDAVKTSQPQPKQE
jgi:hypothetical protein